LLVGQVWCRKDQSELLSHDLAFFIQMLNPLLASTRLDRVGNSFATRTIHRQPAFRDRHAACPRGITFSSFFAESTSSASSSSETPVHEDKLRGDCSRKPAERILVARQVPTQASCVVIGVGNPPNAFWSLV